MSCTIQVLWKKTTKRAQFRGQNVKLTTLGGHTHFTFVWLTCKSADFAKQTCRVASRRLTHDKIKKQIMCEQLSVDTYLVANMNERQHKQTDILKQNKECAPFEFFLIVIVRNKHMEHRFCLFFREFNSKVDNGNKFIIF